MIVHSILPAVMFLYADQQYYFEILFEAAYLRIQQNIMQCSTV